MQLILLKLIANLLHRRGVVNAAAFLALGGCSSSRCSSDPSICSSKSSNGCAHLRHHILTHGRTLLRRHILANGRRFYTCDSNDGSVESEGCLSNLVVVEDCAHL